MIGRLWNSFFKRDEVPTSGQAPLKAGPETAPATQPTDSFSFSVGKSPLMAEIEQMAREMASSLPSTPKPSFKTPLQGAELGDYWQSLGELFEAGYGSALNQKLEGKGLNSLTRHEAENPARAYQVAASKLGAAIAVSTAGEVMKQSMTADQIEQFEANTRAAISLPAMPSATFENVPIFIGKQVAVAASGPQGIYLNPHIHNLPASPFKTFVLGHEKNHVDRKDGIESLGIMLLKTSLEGSPLLAEVAKVEAELNRARENAADRAGTDSALKQFPPDQVESDLKAMLNVIPDDESDSHPATADRIANITAHIERRKSEAKSPRMSGLVVPNTFGLPIFDELNEMARAL